jgi:glucosylceramidase
LDYHPDSKAAISAIAFHCYESDPMPHVQTNLKNAHPEVEIFFTECTESGAVNSFNGDFRWALHNLVIGATRNWASTVIEWNLLLDGNGGPKIGGGCGNCRGLIDILGWDDGNLHYEKRPAYYALGHLSKFAAEGARRIDSSQPDSNTKTVAMLNPDSSALLIVLNNGYPDKSYNVNWFNMICPLTVPSWSAVTLYRVPGSTSVQVWATYDQQPGGLTRGSDLSCSSTGVTPAPNAAPTAKPTASPTASPTAKTTASPTASPT